jgi:rSAM/selenodomain-associated transferase 1
MAAFDPRFYLADPEGIKTRGQFMKVENIRLVLMLKAPTPGRVKTRLAKDLGNEGAAQIYKILVERQASQLPVEFAAEIHFAPANAEPQLRDWLGERFHFCSQSEGDLGERLIHAAREVFASGADRLMFLGGDCPYVTAGLLRECVEQMERHDVVLGPALDGGYYLIGIKRLETRIFEGIDWGTERVLEQTLVQLRHAALTHHLLRELEDVDDLGSWERAKGFLGEGE